MKLAEVVKICSVPLKEVALKYDKNEIDPSFMSNTLGYILYLYKKKVISDDDIIGLNNPVGTVDPSTGKIKNYSTKEEAFITFKESYYDTLDFEAEEIVNNIKSFNLARFDKDLLSSKAGNIIDLPEEKCEPAVDVYKVEKRDSTIATTNNIEEAKSMKEKNPGSVIKNSRGNIVGEKINPTKNVLGNRYEAGTRITCDNINLYTKFKDTSPSRTVSGEYYMYDGKVVNGRIAICKKPEFVGDIKNIVGFVRVCDFK